MNMQVVICYGRQTIGKNNKENKELLNLLKKNFAVEVVYKQKFTM